MNAPERLNVLAELSLPDMQSQPDVRNIAIDAVGIKDIRYPMTIRVGESVVSTIATLSMTVRLRPDTKGTHMSRFVEILEQQSEAINQESFKGFVENMLSRLDANAGSIEMAFPYFRRKKAPVSGIESFLDYDVCWKAEMSEESGYMFRMQVTAAATSLCPCSKEISAYGAHNQRSRLSIEVTPTGVISIDELITIAEQNASCEVFGLLKREDEKYVTERAYENPKFVEDLTRDIASSLNRDTRIAAYVIEAENFESIHNHSAVARIAKKKI